MNQIQIKQLANLLFDRFKEQYVKHGNSYSKFILFSEKELNEITYIDITKIANEICQNRTYPNTTVLSIVVQMNYYQTRKRTYEQLLAETLERKSTLESLYGCTFSELFQDMTEGEAIEQCLDYSTWKDTLEDEEYYKSKIKKGNDYE